MSKFIGEKEVSNPNSCCQQKNLYNDHVKNKAYLSLVSNEAACLCAFSISLLDEFREDLARSVSIWLVVRTCFLLVSQLSCVGEN
jgi:hypothetical protein